MIRIHPEWSETFSNAWNEKVSFFHTNFANIPVYETNFLSMSYTVTWIELTDMRDGVRNGINAVRKLKQRLIKNRNFPKILDIFMFLSLLSRFYAFSRLFSGFQGVFWTVFDQFLCLRAKNRWFWAVFKLKTPTNQRKCCFNFRSACRGKRRLVKKKRT